MNRREYAELREDHKTLLRELKDLREAAEEALRFLSHPVDPDDALIAHDILRDALALDSDRRRN